MSVSSPAQRPEPPMSPAEALDRVVYLLDRSLAPSVKVRAFTRAAETLRELPDGEVAQRVAAGTIQELDGIGSSTGGVIVDAVAGREPAYLARLEAETAVALGAGAPYRAALRGDCHLHSTWSDGGASIETMARTAHDLGHEYIVLTDHSPRLTIAHGLDRGRLLSQFDEIAAVNEQLAPFRILTGMEVDIFEDGSLDLDEDLLHRLDIVVASAHSKFRLPREEMTRRLVLAISSPHVDILGHMTNRMVSNADREAVMRGPTAADAAAKSTAPSTAPRGRQSRGHGDGKRTGSEFDADIVFAAAAQFDTAIEINCRPERQDPPDELVERAVQWGCKVAIDTDAHAPGQLEWQAYGCDKAVRCGVPLEDIINTWPADELLAWAASHPG